METYQISETERFVYTLDTDTPYSYFAGYAYFVQPLLAPYGRTGYWVTSTNEIETALTRFENSGLTGEAKERAIVRYANLLGFVAEVKTFRGYTQGDWMTAMVFTNDSENLPRYVHEVDLLFKGDVWSVSLEEAKVFTADDGEEVTLWRSVDCIGGFVTDDQETLNKYALEAFCVTVTKALSK
jgi:hypothetical protein